MQIYQNSNQKYHIEYNDDYKTVDTTVFYYKKSVLFNTRDIKKMVAVDQQCVYTTLGLKFVRIVIGLHGEL